MAVWTRGDGCIQAALCEAAVAWVVVRVTVVVVVDRVPCPSGEQVLTACVGKKLVLSELVDSRVEGNVCEDAANELRGFTDELEGLVNASGRVVR